MYSLSEINDMRRSEQAFLNVASYCSLYPASYIDRVVVEEMDHVYCVRVFYINNRTNKQFIHSFNFYRLAECKEAERFIELLRENFSNLTVTGDPII